MDSHKRIRRSHDRNMKKYGKIYLLAPVEKTGFNCNMWIWANRSQSQTYKLVQKWKYFSTRPSLIVAMRPYIITKYQIENNNLVTYL